MEALFALSQETMKSNKEIVLSAVLPLLKLLSLTIIGLILAHPKTQIVPRSTFKLLSKLVFALFLPCLIFTQLGQSITLNNFRHWWFIPANVIVSTVIGCSLGYLVAAICRPPPEYFRFTIIMTGFGNTGNLPLAILGSVCHSINNPFGPDCQRTSAAYVSFAQWVAVLLVYTLVYHIMEPPLKDVEIVDVGRPEIEEESPIDVLSAPLLLEAEWPGMEDRDTEHWKTPIIANVFNGNSQATIPDIYSLEEGNEDSPKSIRCLAEPRVVKRIRKIVKQTPIINVLQPPTIASLLAIIIGMTPMLKGFVYGDLAPLSFITDGLDIVAGAMVPSVMLVLGGMLAEGPKESRLGFRTTIGIVIARLVIFPIFGIGVVVFADKMGFLVHGEKMYQFVLLLQYTTPSAILLGAIASLRGYAVGEASALLFWQHIFAVFSLPVYMTLYFKLLLSHDV